MAKKKTIYYAMRKLNTCEDGCENHEKRPEDASEYIDLKDTTPIKYKTPPSIKIANRMTPCGEICNK